MQLPQPLKCGSSPSSSSPLDAYSTVTSVGVRASLSAIYHVLARQPQLLARSSSQHIDSIQFHLPSDVYPVYHALARAAAPNVTVKPFHTLPSPDLHLLSSSSSASSSTAELLLLPAPLSPAGRHLSVTELQSLVAWLSDPAYSRLLVLDSVYVYEYDHPEFRKTLQTLLATGRCAFLFSMAKGVLSSFFSLYLLP